MKRCSISHVITELHIETTVRYYYTPIKIAKIQNTDNTKTLMRLRDNRDSHTLQVGAQNGTAALEDNLEMFTKKQNRLLSYVSAITFLVFKLKTCPHKNLKYVIICHQQIFIAAL